MMKKEYILGSILLIGLAGCGGHRQRPCEECPEEVSCPESCHEDCVKATRQCHIAQAGMPEAYEFDSLFGEDMNEFIALADDMQDSPEQIVMQDDMAFDDALWLDAVLEQEAQKTVFFDFNACDIRDDQQDILSYNVDSIKKEFDQAQAEGLAPMLVVEGHACHSAGSPEYNHQIAMHRAEQVAELYKKAGIPTECIKVVERGAESPLCEGDRESQWKNRRVETRVIYS